MPLSILIEGFVKVKITKESDGNALVSVEDSGIGMNEKYIPYLFDSFTQEEQGYKRKYEGNGLGLALVKKYCELNGAEISVESKKGVGTKFNVKFNRRDDKVIVSTKKSKETENILLQKVKESKAIA